MILSGTENHIVILTGAGISAESGLATFRGTDGLWRGHRPEAVATPEAFARDPDLVHAFYNARRHQLQSPDVVPNAAHRALARLDAAWPGGLLLVTQNVDDLHEQSGSSRLVHMHGELMRVRCGQCGHGDRWTTDLAISTPCPGCGRCGGLRPDVVWFGEMPLAMERILDALERCDLFIAIGTSGSVYPAAGFVETVRSAGAAHTIEINIETSLVASAFAEQRRGQASDLVPVLVRELLDRIETADPT